MYCAARLDEAKGKGQENKARIGGGSKQVQSAQSGQGDDAKRIAGLYLLFDRNMRPTREQLLSALSQMLDASVSHDPQHGDSIEKIRDANKERESNWIELLQWGMTFDLAGIAPGPAADPPEVVYRYSCPADLDSRAMDALVLQAGPHIAGGAHSLPVLRAMLDIGRGLADQLQGVRAVVWGPAKAAIAVPMFKRAVGEWLDGGPVPALGLVGFSASADGKLVSEGLNFLIGQELAIDRSLTGDRVAATRLAVRLVHELVMAGGLDGDSEKVTEDGERIRLHLLPDHLIIRVSPM